ncbi:MAG: diguanylate cyclase [Simkania negevensis]|nr:diguanylate cyclase [Simkania negevensis]
MGVEKESKTLLLFSDSYSTQIFFQKVLQSFPDWLLIVKESEEEALSVLRQIPIDAVVVEEEMENVHLKLFCEKVRSLKDHESIPLLIIIHSLKRSHIRSLISAGATACLQEPLEEEEVKSHLKEAFEKELVKGKIKTISTLVPKTPFSSSLKRSWAVVDDRATKMLKTAEEANNSLAFMMLGIDQYEEVKQKRGKTGEEEVERLTQEFLKNLIRGQDLLLTQKEGKFLILLPKTSPKAAHLIAESFLDSIKNTTLPIRGISSHLTLSIGIVNLEQVKDKSLPSNFNELLKWVLEAFNQARKKGDHIIVYEKT